MEFLAAVFFYIITQYFKTSKEKLGIGMNMMIHPNPIRKWLGYMFNCAKCSSFQLTLILGILMGGDLWQCFLTATSVSFITMMMEEAHWWVKWKIEEGKVSIIKKKLL